MSSAIPNTIVSSMKISSIFSETGHKPVSLQMAVICISICQSGMWMWSGMMMARLWYPDLALIRGKYFASVSCENISLTVGPLWTCYMSGWWSIAGSKHNLTIPIGFGSNTKLLHQSAVIFSPSDMMMSCLCSYSSSSLNDLCNADAIHFGAWCGVHSCFVCNENVPSKCQIPVNTSFKFLFSFYVISAHAP